MGVAVAVTVRPVWVGDADAVRAASADGGGRTGGAGRTPTMSTSPRQSARMLRAGVQRFTGILQSTLDARRTPDVPVAPRARERSTPRPRPRRAPSLAELGPRVPRRVPGPRQRAPHLSGHRCGRRLHARCSGARVTPGEGRGPGSVAAHLV